MGEILRCKKCGYEEKRGYPGIALSFRAKELVEKRLKGKKVSTEERFALEREIEDKLIAEFEATEKKKQKKKCPKSAKGHDFEVIALFD